MTTIRTSRTPEELNQHVTDLITLARMGDDHARTELRAIRMLLRMKLNPRLAVMALITGMRKGLTQP